MRAFFWGIVDSADLTVLFFGEFEERESEWEKMREINDLVWAGMDYETWNCEGSFGFGWFNGGDLMVVCYELMTYDVMIKWST